MKLLRFILFPFAIIYWLVTTLRNYFFDVGILKSQEFDIPIIVVGNLSVGGTGKTPQVESLVRMLQKSYKVAILSRGYKRKSKGFILADSSSTSDILGDEPYQYHQKFPEISVAVDADRSNGIKQLCNLRPNLDVILLDDAFQHRKVKAGLYILLTTFDELYVNDFILPVGNLRESQFGAHRADIVIITKCPENLTNSQKQIVIEKLELKPNQSVFFSKIIYEENIENHQNKISVSSVKKLSKVLVAGIAKPKPFFDFLSYENDVKLEFPDHHDFTASDIVKIKEQSIDKIVITTEKDYTRLYSKLKSDDLYYLGIKNSFFGSESILSDLIIRYVENKKEGL